jgi:hypothetical protein
MRNVYAVKVTHLESGDSIVAAVFTTSKRAHDYERRRLNRALAERQPIRTMVLTYELNDETLNPA